LNGVVNDGGKGSQKVRAVDFGAEKDFRTEETFITNVNRKGTLSDGIFRLVEFDAFGGICVILFELLGEIRADVSVVFLDALCDLEGLSGRNLLLSSFSHQVQHKVCHISSGDRNVLDATSDDISLRDGDDVSNTITGIDDGTGESSFLGLFGGPGGSESKDGLNGNVKTGDVESLKHDLSGVFTILGGIERRLSQEKVMIFGLTTEVFEDALLPELFHGGPIIDLTVSDGILAGIGL